MLKRIQIPLLLLALSLIVKIPLMSSSPAGWDSAGYLCWCKNFLNYDGFYIAYITKLQYCHFFYYLLLDLSSLFSRYTGLISLENAAVMVSVLSGSLAVIPFYYISLFLFKNTAVAAISSLIFIFCPVIWFYGVNVTSDVPALLFMLTGLVFLLRWTDSDENKHLVAGSLLLGLSLTIRNSSVFMLPACFLLVYRQSAKRKNYSPLLISSVVFIPYIISICWYLYVIKVSPYVLFSKTNQHDILLSNFARTEIWVFFIKSMANSLTLLLSFILFIYLLSLTRLRKAETDESSGISLSGALFFAAWILPYAAYWLSLPPGNQHSRLSLFLMPPLVLLASAAVYRVSGIYWRNLKENKLRYFHKIAVFACLIGACADYFLMYAVGMNSVFLNIAAYARENTALAALAVSACIVFYLTFDLLSHKLARLSHGREYILSLVAILIITHMSVYSIPLLVFNKKRISSEKTMALWLKNNTPESSFVISGNEMPCFWYYSYPRKCIYAKTGEKTERLIGKALGEKRVFAFSGNETEFCRPFLENTFTFKVIDIIPGYDIRKQQGPEFTYINLQAFQDAQRIKVYEVKMNDFIYHPVMSEMPLNAKNKTNEIELSNMPACAGIRIESVLANSLNVAQGEKIAEITVSCAGNDMLFDLRAGKDTSEWTYNRYDIKKRLMHKKARTISAYPRQDDRYHFSCSHTFLTERIFKETVKPLKIKLKYCYSKEDAGKVILLIKKLSFLSRDSGAGKPL